MSISPAGSAWWPLTLVDRHKGHLLNHRFSVIPVGGIRHGDQLFVNHPLFQHVGAVAHQLAGAGPVRVALDVGLLHRKQRKVSGQIDKPRQRLIKLNPQGAGIDRRHAEGIGRGFAVDDILRVADARQRREPCKRRGGFGSTSRRQL